MESGLVGRVLGIAERRISWFSACGGEAVEAEADLWRGVVWTYLYPIPRFGWQGCMKIMVDRRGGGIRERDGILRKGGGLGMECGAFRAALEIYMGRSIAYRCYRIRKVILIGR